MEYLSNYQQSILNASLGKWSGDWWVVNNFQLISKITNKLAKQGGQCICYSPA